MQHASVFKTIFEEADNKGFVAVQWGSGNFIREESKLAWYAGEPKFIKVQNPKIDNIIALAKESNFEFLWVQKSNTAWLVRKAFSYKTPNGSHEGL